ncbi:MAG: glycosyltransferase family 39 protein, partial [Planctomycetaceae bacterium]
ALYAAGRRWFSPTAGWLAALIYLSTPWTFRISTIAYVEGGLSFFLFTALLATMLAIEQLSREQRAGGRVLLAGLLAGSAMACKYPGVLSVVIPLGAALVAAPFLLGIPRAASIKITRRWAACFASGVLLTIGPWLAKNAFETGNPVYPLLYSVFDGKDWNAELDAKWKKAHSPDDYDLGKIPAWICDVSAQNDWLSPLLYAFAPLLLVVAWRRRMPRLLWFYVGYLFLTWWAFTHRLDRFWVPMIPVVALLAGAGATSLKGTVWKIFSAVCIAAALLFNLGIVVTGMAGYNQFLVDLDYARDWTANLTAPEIAYLNREFRAGELPKDARVLCVGEAEVFDAEFPIVYNTVFDYPIFEQWTADDRQPVASGERAMRDPAEIRQKFRDERIGLVLVNWQEIVRYRTTYGYTDFVAPPRFDRLEEARVLTPPLTFASLVLADLTDEELETKRKAWKPGLYRLQDGRTVYIGSVRKPLDQREADEITRWAPSLFGRIEQGRVLITSQIYRVPGD